MSRGKPSNHRASITSWPGRSSVDCARAMTIAPRVSWTRPPAAQNGARLRPRNAGSSDEATRVLRTMGTRPNRSKASPIRSLHSPGHIDVSWNERRRETLLNGPSSLGPRERGASMPLDDVSDRSNKVYDTMKSAGITSEDKMRDAEAITKMSKLPKNFVLTALQQLQAKGYAKRRAREKAAGYWLIK